MSKYLEYDSVAEFISVYYNEPHRSYHTFDHIERMFSDAHEHNLNLTVSQGIAILFHDIVYTPGSNTNEEDSARLLKIAFKKFPGLFKNSAALGFGENIIANKEDVEEACDIILDTKTHNASFEPSKLVIDLDLLGLSDEYNNYLAAGCLVKDEFIYLSEKQWLVGRSAFLLSFINRNKIFQTEYFRVRYESHARDNMSRELEDVMDKLQ